MSRIDIGNFYSPALKYDHVAQSNIMELSSPGGTLPNLLNSKIRKEITQKPPASVPDDPTNPSGPLQSSVGSPGFQGTTPWIFSMTSLFNQTTQKPT